MIRRTFKYTEHDGEARDVELIVTYDADTDTLNVGHRDHSYDEWSRPLEMIENQDDPQGVGGRRGGPGSVRGDGYVASDEALIEQMRQIVATYDARPVVPDVAPSDQFSTEPNLDPKRTSDE